MASPLLTGLIDLFDNALVYLFFPGVDLLTDLCYWASKAVVVTIRTGSSFILAGEHVVYLLRLMEEKRLLLISADCW